MSNRFSRTQIDDLLQRIDIVEYIGKRLKLKKSGYNYFANCPFHEEKSPSFCVNINKQIFHCFGCSKTGNVINFSMQYYTFSFIDAVKSLAAEYGVILNASQEEYKNFFNNKKSSTDKAISNTKSNTQTIEPIPKTSIESQTIQHNQNSESTQQNKDNQAVGQNNINDNIDQSTYLKELTVYTKTQNPITSSSEVIDDNTKNKLYSLFVHVVNIYRNNLANHEIARNYLIDRGINAQTIDDFSLGYANSQNQILTQYPEHKNLLQDAGLIISYDNNVKNDRFRARIIFPIRDIFGKIIGIGGRVINDNIKPKYLNSPETVLFNKSFELYGLFEAKSHVAKHGSVIVVEGYFDTVVLHQFGIKNVVATMGTALTAYHVRKLLRLCDKIYFCFDGDEAGRKAAWRSLQIGAEHISNQKSLRFYFLDAMHDPDSYIRQFGKDCMLDKIYQHSVGVVEFLFFTIFNQFAEVKAIIMQKYQTYQSQTPQHLMQIVRQKKQLLQHQTQQSQHVKNTQNMLHQIDIYIIAQLINSNQINLSTLDMDLKTNIINYLKPYILLMKGANILVDLIKHRLSSMLHIKLWMLNKLMQHNQSTTSINTQNTINSKSHQGVESTNTQSIENTKSQGAKYFKNKSIENTKSQYNSPNNYWQNNKNNLLSSKSNIIQNNQNPLLQTTFRVQSNQTTNIFTAEKISISQRKNSLIAILLEKIIKSLLINPKLAREYDHSSLQHILLNNDITDDQGNNQHKTHSEYDNQYLHYLSDIAGLISYLEVHCDEFVDISLDNLLINNQQFSEITINLLIKLYGEIKLELANFDKLHIIKLEEYIVLINKFISITHHI